MNLRMFRRRTDSRSEKLPLLLLLVVLLVYDDSPNMVSASCNAPFTIMLTGKLCISIITSKHHIMMMTDFSTYKLLWLDLTRGHLQRKRKFPEFQLGRLAEIRCCG